MILRAGVICFGRAVVVAGVSYICVHYGTATPITGFSSGNRRPALLAGIINDALALNSRGIIQLGLLLLIATPIVRVALRSWPLRMQRDRVYVIVTLSCWGCFSIASPAAVFSLGRVAGLINGLRKIAGMVWIL